MGLKYSDLIEELIQLAFESFYNAKNFIITKKKITQDWDMTRLWHVPVPVRGAKHNEINLLGSSASG